MQISRLLIRKMIMQWLFPPGGIIIIILLIYLLFILNKKKIASYFTIFLVFFLFLFSSWVGEFILLRPLEDDFISLQEIAIKDLNLSNPIMVVLGGSMVENSLAEKKGKTEIGEITLARLYGAYRIYSEIECPIWVSGGTVPGFNGNTPVANIMEQVLENLGIPSEKIYREIESRTTFENARFTLEEIGKQGYHEIILVTSAVHMRRSVQVFENGKVVIIPAPVNYLFENAKPGILNILPNRSSWNHNLRALHEWVGIIYYNLFLLRIK